ncbi:MAG: 2-hydroxyacyl-CoA dehydratase [Verrucomicrobia bacterium]|nr:2-hydroxyacyl-CoA dehydratase [Verrucomicrobiota bacterium]
MSESLGDAPRKLGLDAWDQRYAALRQAGLSEPEYGGPLGRHVFERGDLRLRHLEFDNSAAALRLWNFLLTENERLRQARTRGEKIVGTMKDLGTVPVMAYALPRVRAFYPDGAWWTPCLMECSDGLLQQADLQGIDGSFCPVRALLPAFETEAHFPQPDWLVCSTGAVCDDFTAIAQRLERLGHPICWWEMPRRRSPDPGEPACTLPGGGLAPAVQVQWVRDELERVRAGLSGLVGQPLTDEQLRDGIREANRVRRLLGALREAAHGAPSAPLPALELLVAEMLTLHFCSDRDETVAVLAELLVEVQTRCAQGHAVLAANAVRVYWVNPVADLRVLNRLEEWGGRVCGSDYMFTHALDLIPETLPPLEALARTALADPMVGPTADRAERIVAECRAWGAEALVVARIPGASHCAREGAIIREEVRAKVGLPTIDLEIPPVCDAMLPTLDSRLQALLEAARARRST